MDSWVSTATSGTQVQPNPSTTATAPNHLDHWVASATGQQVQRPTNPTPNANLTWLTDPYGNAFQTDFKTAAKLLNNGQEYGGDDFYHPGKYISGVDRNENVRSGLFNDTGAYRSGVINSLGDTVASMAGVGSQEDYNNAAIDAEHPLTADAMKRTLLRTQPGITTSVAIAKSAVQSAKNTVNSLGNAKDAIARAYQAIQNGDTEQASAQLEDATGHITEASGHALAIGAAPVGGGIAERAGKQVGEGDIGGAAATVSPLVAPAVIKAGGAIDEAAGVTPAAGRAIRATGRTLEKVAPTVGKTVGTGAGATVGAAAGHATGIPYAGHVGADIGAAAGYKFLGKPTQSLVEGLGRRLSQSDIGMEPATFYDKPAGPLDYNASVPHDAADLENGTGETSPQAENLRPEVTKQTSTPTSTEDTEGQTNPQIENNREAPVHAHNEEAAQEMLKIAQQREDGGLLKNAIGYRKAANAIRGLGDQPFTAMSDDDLAKIPGIGQKTLPLLQSLRDNYLSASKFAEAARQNDVEEAAAQGGDRRQNLQMRKTVDQMTPEEMKKTLLTSDKVDLPNARAFQDAQVKQPAPAVAFSDADGLKWVNDTFGHDAGDALLQAKADALKKAGIDAFHKQGDEFLGRGQDTASLAEKYEQARKNLQNTPIRFRDKNGDIVRIGGADFSYGVGPDMNTAENGMYQMKSGRPARGAQGNIKVLEDDEKK